MFYFNFQTADKESRSKDSLGSVQKEKLLTWLPSAKFELSQDLIQKILQQNFTLEERSFGTNKIKFLSQDSINSKLSSSDVSEAITTSEKLHLDLVPAVYEGGFKIWECTWDLLGYLSTASDVNLAGKHVLELGCGAGLVGVYAALQGAAVALQDYNEDVIRHVTVPNVLYNVASYTDAYVGVKATSESDGDADTEHKPSDVSIAINDSALEEIKERIEFYYGDWSTLPKLLCKHRRKHAGSEDCANNRENGKFDFILTSETVYNEDNYEKLLETLISCLAKSGTILVAGKSHYFGVGGGMASFFAAAQQTGRFQCRTVARHTAGVVREVIEMKFAE